MHFFKFFMCLMMILIGISSAIASRTFTDAEDISKKRKYSAINEEDLSEIFYNEDDLDYFQEIFKHVRQEISFCENIELTPEFIEYYHNFFSEALDNSLNTNKIDYRHFKKIIEDFKKECINVDKFNKLFLVDNQEIKRLKEINRREENEFSRQKNQGFIDKIYKKYKINNYTDFLKFQINNVKFQKKINRNFLYILCENEIIENKISSKMTISIFMEKLKGFNYNRFDTVTVNGVKRVKQILEEIYSIND